MIGDGGVKVKFLNAYESSDSVTIRVTPQRLGRLISQVPTLSIDGVVEEFKDQVIFMDQERKEDLLGLLNKMRLVIIKGK